MSKPHFLFLLAVYASKFAFLRGFQTFLAVFQVGKESYILNSNEDDTPYELLYGRVGYLWSALFVNKQLGYDAISASTLVSFLLFHYKFMQ